MRNPHASRRPGGSPIQDQRQDKHFETGHLRADLQQRSARGLAVTLTARAVQFALALGLTAALARLLTPDDFGLIAMVSVLTSLVTTLSDTGLSTATVQRSQVTQAQMSALFWINVLVSAVCVAAVGALAPVVTWFYGRRELTWITLALAGTIIFGGLTVQHQALLRRQMRFGALALIDLAAVFGAIAVGIPTAWLGAGYWSIVGMCATAPAVTAALCWLVCDWRPHRPMWHSEVWPLVAFGGNLTGVSIVNYLARNIDNVLIGWRWGAVALGFYTKAYSLLLFPLRQFNAPMTGVVVPTLSRLQTDEKQYRETYLRIVEQLALVAMPAVAFLIAAARPTVFVILGPQWEPAACIFGWLGLSALIQPLASTTDWLLVSQNRTNDMLRIGAVNSALAVLSMLVGLPWGALGVAACYAVSDVVVRTPLLFWYVVRKGPIRVSDYFRTVAPATVIASCVWLAVCGCRLLIGEVRPVADLAISLAAALVAGVALCLLLPRTRAVLWDLCDMARRMR